MSSRTEFSQLYSRKTPCDLGSFVKKLFSLVEVTSYRVCRHLSRFTLVNTYTQCSGSVEFFHGSHIMLTNWKSYVLRGGTYISSLRSPIAFIYLYEMWCFLKKSLNRKKTYGSGKLLVRLIHPHLFVADSIYAPTTSFFHFFFPYLIIMHFYSFIISCIFL